MDGWVKLYRRFLNWQWFSRPEMVQIFIYILLSASHKDHVWQCVDIRRGEFPTSVDALVRATGLTTQQVRTCLTRLERTGEIVRKSTNKYTIISVCNFDDYQIDEDADQQSNNNQITNNQQSNNNQITTLGEWKERKNGNNGENISSKKEQQQDISLKNKSREAGFSLADLSTEDRVAEERAFYKVFFFANALHPGKQVKQFIAANERKRWTGKGGVVWWTPAQRLAAADGYTLDNEFQTCGNNELWLVERIYKALTESGNPNADKWILRDSVGCVCTTSDAMNQQGPRMFVLYVPTPCVDYFHSVAGETVIRSLGLTENYKLYFDNHQFPRKK